MDEEPNAHSPWMPPSTGGGSAPPTLPAPPVAAAPPLPPPVSDATLVDPVAEQPRRKRSKLLVGGVVAAVVAVGAAGVFAVSNLSEDSAGGAADPTELGTLLLTAIENEDVLGMVDVLAPGERDLFRQPLIDLVSELTRLEVLAPEADLGKIAGLDVALADESVAARTTNVPDIVNVDMAAEATSTIDGEQVPIGALITDNMDPDHVSEIRGSRETTTEHFEFTLTAVEHEGRWYFSLFHTAAEAARGELEPRPDIPAEGIGANGAESPEGAFDQILDSIETLDLTALIRSLNPGEAAALQRYAPLFLDEAQAELDQTPAQLEITDRQFRVEGDGDQRTVLVDALTITGSVDVDGEQVEFSAGFEGDCVHAEGQGETFEMCAGETLEGVDEALAEMPAVKAFIDAIGRALADIQPIGIEVRSFDGEWYVSPTATGSEAILAFLRALDRQEIDELLSLGEAAVEEFFGSAFGGLGSFEDDLSFDEEFSFDDEFSLDDEFSMDDEFSFGDDFSFDEEFSFDDDFSIDGSFGGSEDATATPWDDCYSELAAAEAAACFQQYIDSGEIEAAMVPSVLRFPECGLAELSWESGLYSLSDEEFTAALTAARPCFQALVDSGQIEEYEVPSEVLQLECYEGRNWYNVFDDPEYDERYYACLEELYAS